MTSNRVSRRRWGSVAAWSDRIRDSGAGAAAGRTAALRLRLTLCSEPELTGIHVPETHWLPPST